MTITVENYLTPPNGAASNPESLTAADSVLPDGEAVAAEHAPAALCGARGELAVVSVQLDNANEALQRAQQPPRRLQRCLVDADLAARDLAAAQATERDIVAAWLSGGRQGPRPEPSKALLGAEERVAETARDAAAARQALPDHEAVVSAAARHVNELTRERDRLHREVVLEAIADHLQHRLVPAIRAMRTTEKAAWDVADAFSRLGDDATAQRIAEMIGATKGSTVPPAADVSAGRAFLAAVLHDPSRELGA